MDRVMLGNNLCCSGVIIPCEIIDKHLKDANEAQLKIYLYLLRNRTDGMISVETIADYFNYTVQDVERALRFWGLRGNLESDGAGDNVVNFKNKPSYTASQLAEFAKRSDIQELLFVTEQYVGCSMSPDLISTVLYMYDALHFDTDLIIYLFEYCVEHKKKKLYQIEAVANEWCEAGVKTVEDATAHTVEIPKEAYDTLKAFGIKLGLRDPVASEIAYVNKWVKEYGFSMDIIAAACERTVMKIHEPNFSYANSILFGWYESDVKTLEDIDRLDKEFKKQKEEESDKKSSEVIKQSSSRKSKTSSNRFNNFEQRTYDFVELEKEVKWQ